MNKIIAVITPISHLDGICKLLQTKGHIFMAENYDKQSIRELLLCHNIDTILCNPNTQTYKIDKYMLYNTNVKLINTCSTGLNHIDMEYCVSNDITVYSLKTDMRLLKQLPATSELAFGLLMDLSRNITKSHNHLFNGGKWNYTQFIGNQIKNMNIGIVGYGRLGKMMANYCKSFGANVYIYDPYIKLKHYEKSIGKFIDNLSELFDVCDAISLHVHVTDETKYMINMSLLERNVKYLINTSRGEIVCENMIVMALKAGVLEGYGTDVIEDEFGDINNSPIIKNMNKLNIIVTPHIGGMTVEGQIKAYKWAINKL